MKTEELLDLIKIKEVIGKIPFILTGIQMDSRKVAPGNAFVCITGETSDGSNFIKEAITNGAVLIIAAKNINLDFKNIGLVIVKDPAKVMARLANHFYGYPSSHITAFGVTGTNGKTTVSHLIHQLLLQIGQKSACAGTLGFQLNDSLTPTPNTTSDIISNLEMLRTAIDQECDAISFEISSHGLSKGRIWGIEFDIAIFTNLSPDHLDYHETMERYGHAKGLLFSQLGQNVRKAKYAILNFDDPWTAAFSQMTPYEVISYGLSPAADFFATDLYYAENGISFQLHCPAGSFSVTTAFVGEFNVYNVLAAIAALFAYGVEMDVLTKALPLIQPVNGRMEKLRNTIGPAIYIDYAHTPDAVEKAIQSVLPFAQGRIIVLIAGGNYREITKRPEIAEQASKADFVVITTNNPGTEAPEKILADLEKGMLHDRYIKIANRKEAVQYAIDIAEPEDIVLLTDKGHETTLLVGNERVPHSDKEIAMDRLKTLYTSSMFTQL